MPKLDEVFRRGVASLQSVQKKRTETRWELFSHDGLILRPATAKKWSTYSSNTRTYDPRQSRSRCTNWMKKARISRRLKQTSIATLTVA
ncbi:hypothetical protein GQ600_25781 [Phytophthora cactorum]|nr:hypothetical protein GQ600_25781 [Phytophthora cactorum]